MKGIDGGDIDYLTAPPKSETVNTGNVTGTHEETKEQVNGQSLPEEILIQAAINLFPSLKPITEGSDQMLHLGKNIDVGCCSAELCRVDFTLE